MNKKEIIAIPNMFRAIPAGILYLLSNNETRRRVRMDVARNYVGGDI